MKKFILLLLSLSIFSWAQSGPTTMQDDPDLNWKKIESFNFKIIYPDFLEKRAVNILNLLEHYRDKVGESYGVLPKKLTLVIRPQMSSPNGFVTLAPRRSEWFSSEAFTPMVGALDWYQSLAIHEFRHVIQMDYMIRPNVNIGYYLFGEMGAMVLMNIVAPTWWFEGDAVYAETLLSDAGRGRSPRFSARLKSVLQQGVPSYDQLLAGDYTTMLPNHYVFGYFLSARAYREFGPNVWKEVMGRAARFPIWPMYFYSSFEAVTGVSFEQFYQDTMIELKTKWQIDVEQGPSLYSEYDYPMGEYYLKRDLDSFWSLYQGEKKLVELNIDPTMSRADVGRGKFVYTIDFQHYRYSFKGDSDLYLYDIEKKKSRQLTKGLRLYHPQLHPNKDKILAIEFDPKHNWTINQYDFSGQQLSKVNLGDESKVTEAVYVNDQTVAAFLLDHIGRKRLALVDLTTGEISNLTVPTRNNLYSLSYNDGRVLFEADYKGTVNIFSLSLSDKKFNQCTFGPVAAFRPHLQGDEFNYVSVNTNGRHIKNGQLSDCKIVDWNLAEYDYLGDTPSDNFTASAPIPLPLSKAELDKVNEHSFDYSETEDAFRPHSWSFIGRGLQLGVYAQSMLSTSFWSAAIGTTAEESRPYANLSISYAKYLPIISLDFDYVERNHKFENRDEASQWQESYAGLTAIVPMNFQSNLWQQNITLMAGVGNMYVSEVKGLDVDYQLSDDQLMIKTGAMIITNAKQKTYRQLMPSWGQRLTLMYKDGQATDYNYFSSYLGYGNLDLYFPGIMHNDGLKLSGWHEYQRKGDNHYRFSSPAQSPTGYVYSRGYSYDFFPDYSKGSLEYRFPISYPNQSATRWFYFNRLSGTVFYDHTYVQGDDSSGTLNSYGTELHLESLTFRKIPLTYSLRLIKKERGEDRNVTEFFLGSSLMY